MEIKTLYTLLAIVDHRSFSEAGKAVGLSASGVSLQIKSLEAEFGVTLFDRSTRPPTLTWDGQAFVSRARELLDVWEDLSHGLAKDTLAGILHQAGAKECAWRSRPSTPCWRSSTIAAFPRPARPWGCPRPA